ncbi:hypothetical protein Dimus_022127, partial [Dionaea muscipula]
EADGDNGWILMADALFMADVDGIFKAWTVAEPSLIYAVLKQSFMVDVCDLSHRSNYQMWRKWQLVTLFVIMMHVWTSSHVALCNPFIASE